MTPAAIDELLRKLDKVARYARGDLGLPMADDTELQAMRSIVAQWAATNTDPIETAKRFHEAYERLAPSFGYETRPDTRQFDPESPNGKLMIAVCGELWAAGQSQEMAEPSDDEKKMVTITYYMQELPEKRSVSVGTDETGELDGFFMRFVNDEAVTRLRLSNEAMHALIALVGNIYRHANLSSECKWLVAEIKKDLPPCTSPSSAP